MNRGEEEPNKTEEEEGKSELLPGPVCSARSLDDTGRERERERDGQMDTHTHTQNQLESFVIASPW